MSLNSASNPRIAALLTWLSTLSNTPTLANTLEPASSDASFRRYFRVQASGQNKTYIIMDAPPDKENILPFINAAAIFHEARVSVPQILASNIEQGFLLLSDFGNTTYLQQLTEHNSLPKDDILHIIPKNKDVAHLLYQDALHALIEFQSLGITTTLPKYNRSLLLQELMLFPEWFLKQHHHITLSEKQLTELNSVFDIILANNLAQNTVLVHRDYHSRNLMFISSGNPGILDFQDAVCGPITYDLVSLLRDAYIEWEEEDVLDWTIRYWEKAKRHGLPVNPDIDLFYKDFELMGLQRHLKVLGIFARLYHRDGKEGYLKDIPLVLKYVQKTARRYKELSPLVRLLEPISEQTQKVGYTF